MKRIARMIQAGQPFRFDGRRIIPNIKTRISASHYVNKRRNRINAGATEKEAWDIVGIAQSYAAYRPVQDACTIFTTWEFWHQYGDGQSYLSVDADLASEILEALREAIGNEELGYDAFDIIVDTLDPAVYNARRMS